MSAFRALCRMLLLACLLLQAPSARLALGQGLTQTFGPAEQDARPRQGLLRIVGGEEAPLDQWPSLVGIFVETSKGTGFCGGSVIDTNWVLTAGHCVTDHTPKGTWPPKAFTVIEGTKDLNSGGRRHGVVRVVLHPDFKTQNDVPFGDVALLQLADEAAVPRQVLMPMALRDAILHDGTSSTVAGFGRTSDGGRPSTTLLQVNMPLVGTDRCETVYPGQVWPHNICAGVPEGGKDSCQGDSGGPLYVPGPGGMPVQAGIVSWGEGCGQQGRYGVYAAVPDFERFIRYYVKNAAFAPADPVAPSINAVNGTGANLPPGQTANVTIDVDKGTEVKAGTDIRIRVQSSVAGTLILLDVDSTGKVTQLFPNKYSATRPGALQAWAQIQPGVPVIVPGYGDSFALTADRPYGENRLVAVIAPPNTKGLDLLGENDRMEPVADAPALLARLAQRLAEARAAQNPVNADYQGTRAINVRPAKPLVPVGERAYRVVP